MQDEKYKQLIVDELTKLIAKHIYDKSIIPKLLEEDPEFIYHYNVEYWAKYLEKDFFNKTNSSWLRNLSDQELAILLNDLCGENCNPYCIHYAEYGDEHKPDCMSPDENPNCIGGCIAWLRSNYYD